MTLRASNQVLCNVWSYDFYDMTLSTELQQRHMIKPLIAASSGLRLFCLLGLYES